MALIEPTQSDTMYSSWNIGTNACICFNHMNCPEISMLLSLYVIVFKCTHVSETKLTTVPPTVKNHIRQWQWHFNLAASKWCMLFLSEAPTLSHITAGLLLYCKLILHGWLCKLVMCCMLPILISQSAVLTWRGVNSLAASIQYCVSKYTLSWLKCHCHCLIL